jgi:hypothetical protein
MSDYTIEFIELACILTDELKKIAGNGASDEWLGKCRELRELFDVNDDISIPAAGRIVKNHLRKSINVIPDSRFEGRLIEARQLRMGLNRLLSEGPAPVRRNDTMLYIGYIGSESHWRKVLEWKFLYILAESLAKARYPDHQI